MHTLRGIAIEGGAVIATDQQGTNFRVEIDDALRARLRDSTGVTAITRKLSPREIQTQIRAGLTAGQVADITGAPLEYIQRYEGPVLAERRYVVESALGVPVRSIDDDDPEAAVPSFGGVMADRLVQLAASEPEWSSWKEEAGGWVLRLAFTADDIDHDARWRFDPKKLVLSPLNAEAVALSQAGEIGASLMPRLRAVPAAQEASRFDSAAFEPLDITPEVEAEKAEQAFTETVVTHEPLRYGKGRVIEPRTGAISIAPEKPEPSETSDLLEALRRRRGEREASSFDDAPRTEEPARTGTATVRVLDRQRQASRGEQAGESAAPIAAPEASTPSPAAVAPASDAKTQTPQRKQPSSETMPLRPARRGRTAMPSWDEIVFGARPDDEA